MTFCMEMRHRSEISLCHIFRFMANPNISKLKIMKQKKRQQITKTDGIKMMNSHCLEWRHCSMKKQSVRFGFCCANVAIDAWCLRKLLLTNHLSIISKWLSIIVHAIKWIFMRGIIYFWLKGTQYEMNCRLKCWSCSLMRWKIHTHLKHLIIKYKAN